MTSTMTMGGNTRVLGGITVIDTPLIARAMDYARTHSEPFLFNHAVRSWLFAVRLGQLQGVPHDSARLPVVEPGPTGVFDGCDRSCTGSIVLPLIHPTSKEHAHEHHHHQRRLLAFLRGSPETSRRADRMMAAASTTR
jgi:hypothetical protein